MTKHTSRLLIAPFLIGFILLASAFADVPLAHAAVSSQQPNIIKPHYNACEANWYYDNLTGSANHLSSVGPTQSDYNGTGSNVTATFSATTSGTVTVTASANVEIQAGVIVSGVKASFGVSVATAITASLGNNVTMTIPSHKTGYASYGVWEVVTTGHYYYMNQYCEILTDDGYITTYTPSYVGWNIWTA